MIFKKEHIEMIRNGLQTYPSLPSRILPKFHVKTQTRRVNRGKYQVGRDYAVQRKQGVKAEEGLRIVISKIRKETGKTVFVSKSGRKYTNAIEICITKEDAWAEGNYIPSLFELDFRKAYPKWDGWVRWAFEFHVKEVRK